MKPSTSFPDETAPDLAELTKKHPAVANAHQKLQNAVNFKVGSPWTDVDNFFKVSGKPDLDHDKLNKDEKYGCKKKTFHYESRQGRQCWWNEVVIQVQNAPDPKLVASQEFALVIHFHGGGFTSGDVHHGAWKQTHMIEFGAKNPVILVYPNYPLMPWHDGCDIIDAADQFWRYLYSATFKEHVQTVHPGLKARFTNLCVSGDSAGAWLAMYSFMSPHQTKSASGKYEPIDIGVVNLQYPMLAHYQRAVSDAGMTWLKEPAMSKQDIAKAALNLERAWTEYHVEVTKAGLDRLKIPVTRPWAPFGMGASFLGSCHINEDGITLWQQMFQNGKSILDILERLRNSTKEKTTISRPRTMPEFIVFQGGRDMNCPIQNTTEVFGPNGLIVKKYGETIFRPGIFQSIGDKIMYDENDPDLKDFGHGFDHNFSMKHPALVKYYDQLEAKLWP